MKRGYGAEKREFKNKYLTEQQTYSRLVYMSLFLRNAVSLYFVSSRRSSFLFQFFDDIRDISRKICNDNHYTFTDETRI